MAIPPIKPVYGVYDFDGQVVLPPGPQPPTPPIEGSMYASGGFVYVWHDGTWVEIGASGGGGVGTGVAIVQPAPPDPTGLPEGTWWVDEDSDVTASGGLDQAAADGRYLQLTGGTLTGDLDATGYSITSTVMEAGQFYTDQDGVRIAPPLSTPAALSLETNAGVRWKLVRDSTTGAANAGANFAIERYNDAGTKIDSVLTANRATGEVTIAKPLTLTDPVPTSANHAASKQYVDGKSGGHTVQDEGVALASRAGLNFAGAGVTATDDAANNRTLITIPGATGGLDQTAADARYINVTGDTMTGPLTVNADFTVAGSYIDIEGTNGSFYTASTRVGIEGYNGKQIRLLTDGYLSLQGGRVFLASNEPIWIQNAAGTSTQRVTNLSAPIDPNDAVNKAHLDTALAGVSGGTPVYQYTKHTPAAAVASDEYSTDVAANSIDGNTTTKWQSNSSNIEHWLRLDLTTAKTVSRVRIHAGQSPTSIIVESSPDNTAWTTRYTTAAPIAGWNQYDFTAATARYWRVRGTISFWLINEIEYWGNTVIGTAVPHAVQDEGTLLTPRAGLNFAGAGVTATDDLANDRTLVTIPGGLDQTTADARYVQLTGGTLTGPINTPGLGSVPPTVEFITSATVQASTNALSLVMPASIVAGDLLLMLVSWEEYGGSVTTSGGFSLPPGFTLSAYVGQFGNGLTGGAWYSKIATGADASATTSWTFGGTEGTRLSLLVLRNAGQPTQVYDGNANLSIAANALATPITSTGYCIAAHLSWASAAATSSTFGTLLTYQVSGDLWYQHSPDAMFRGAPVTAGQQSPAVSFTTTGEPQGTGLIFIPADTSNARIVSTTDIDFGGTKGPKNIRNPVVAADAANKAYVDTAVAGVSGGASGFMGPWSSLTAYPAGSSVTYNGLTWGTVSAIAAGQSAPALPGTVVPTGTDAAASAPEIIIATNGENASSAIWNPVTYTSESGEPAPYASQQKAYSGWLKYTPISSGSVTFTTEGSGDTYLTMYQWTGGASAFSFGFLTEMARHDGVSWSTITQTVTSGTTYYFQIGNWGAPTTNKFNLVGARATAPGANTWTLLPAHTVQDEGTALATRAGLNFVGAGVTATDDAANNRTLVTIPGSAGGGLDQTTADARYLQLTGGTLSNALTVPRIEAKSGGGGTVVASSVVGNLYDSWATSRTILVPTGVLAGDVLILLNIGMNKGSMLSDPTTANGFTYRTWAGKAVGGMSNQTRIYTRTADSSTLGGASLTFNWGAADAGQLVMIALRGVSEATAVYSVTSDTSSWSSPANAGSTSGARFLLSVLVAAVWQNTASGAQNTTGETNVTAVLDPPATGGEQAVVFHARRNLADGAGIPATTWSTTLSPDHYTVMSFTFPAAAAALVVDSAAAGTVFGGPVTLAGAPTASLHPVTKAYTDARTPNILVLGPTDPVPEGTPAGTIIVTRAT